MHHLNRSHLSRALALVSLLALGACSSSSNPGTTGGTGGSSTGTGGTSTGTGGTSTGTGGTSTGTGGSTSGTGGSATGGTLGTGGHATGGAGGGSTGTGSGTGGATGGSTGRGGAAGGYAGNGGVGGHVSGTGGAAGGSAGGAPGSGGSAGGSSGSCKYKLCEDFESSTVGSIPTGWTSFKGYNGTIGAMDQAVAMDQAHGGTKSLKSIAASQGTARVQKALSGLGTTANKHWGRIFYKVQNPSAVDNSHVLHTTFVSLMGGSTEDRIVDTVETQAAHTHQWLFNAPDDQCCTASQYNWTFDDAWHCAEWYVEATTKNQQAQVSYRFFSDSKEVTDIGFSNRSAPELPAAYDTIILGATYYQTDTLTGPFTMWIDDLAINDTQIGCQ